MKQFNLEEYLKNPSRKVVTRDGRKVTRFLCTDLKNEFPIAAAVESCEGAYPEDLLTYRNNGTFYNEVTIDRRDLFFAPEKHEGWLNIYRSNECGFYIRGNSPYKSKEKADAVAKANPKTFFTTIKVEWEE